MKNSLRKRLSKLIEKYNLTLIFLKYRTNELYFAEFIIRDIDGYLKLKYNTTQLSLKYYQNRVYSDDNFIKMFCYDTCKDISIERSDYDELIQPILNDILKLNKKTFNLLHNQTDDDTAQASILLYEKTPKHSHIRYFQ
jgi:hypothetical protein